jgi:hypothetical protein
MITFQIRAVLERRTVSDKVALYLFDRSAPGDVIAHALPIVFRSMKTSEISETIDPAIELPRETAQELLEELWRLGFRPSKEGSEGQLAAVTRHLEDQRALSWRLLDLVAQRWRSDELHVFTTEEKSS